MIYTVLSTTTLGRKVSKLDNTKTKYTAFIVDKVSMIKFQLLRNMHSQLWKAKKDPEGSIALFDKLSLVMLLDNFYQFFSIGEKLL